VVFLFVQQCRQQGCMKKGKEVEACIFTIALTLTERLRQSVSFDYCEPWIVFQNFPISKAVPKYSCVCLELQMNEPRTRKGI